MDSEEDKDKTEFRGDGKEENDDDSGDDLFGGSDDDSDDDEATQAPTQAPSQFENGLSDEDDEDNEDDEDDEDDDKGKGKEREDDLLPDDDLFGSDDDEGGVEVTSSKPPVDLSSIEKVFTDVVPRPQEGASLMVFGKPKALDFEPTPFIESRYLEEVDPLSTFQPNVVRWRYRETSDGKIVPETNAHIVRFGDGSMHLFIGKRPVGTFGARATAAPNSYLYSHSINHLVSIGRMKNSCFYPIAKKGRRVSQRSLDEKTKDQEIEGMVRIISTDSEFLKQEDEPINESNRKQREKLLDRQNKYAQRTDFMGVFLEKGARGSDDDDDGDAVLPRRYDSSSDNMVSEDSDDIVSEEERISYRDKHKKKTKRKRMEDSPVEDAPSFLDDDDEEEGFVLPREKKKRRVIADDDDEDD